MTLLTQQKTTRIVLAVYWPTLFISSHIPVPQTVQEAGVSDKNLHFLAYLTLFFLLWFAFNGVQRIDWRKARPWWVFFGIAVYGILDEFLQGFVPGRSPDVMDFMADMTGVLASVLLCTVLTFWLAGLLVTAAVIFGLANVSRVDLAAILPVMYAVFHLFAYAVFTALWIQCVHLYICVSGKIAKARWAVLALSAPVGLLATVKLSAVFFGKGFTLADTIISAVAIAAVTAAFYRNTYLNRAQGAIRDLTAETPR